MSEDAANRSPRALRAHAATAAALVLDAIAAVLLGAVLFVLATGGGVYSPGGVHVSLRSVGNPLAFLAAVTVARYWLRHAAPLAGNPRWSYENISAACRRACSALHDSAPHRHEQLVLAGIVIVSVSVKLWLAWAHPGFFSGDDVEVHEMTLGALLAREWPVWELRNPFFPMGVVYPAQWLAYSAGVSDVSGLVFTGRAAVAVLSTGSIWLIWVVAKRMFTNHPRYAVAAAVLLATNKLQMAFGSSELPRPVSTAAVLAAFALLAGRSGLRAPMAGVLLGAAAAFRFSEAVFLVPALAQLVIERRARDALACLSAAIITGAVVLGVSDALYWGAPFSSMREAIDYTLVQRLSSRGYQSPVWYVANVAQWSTWVVVGLAVWGIRTRTRPAALWTGIPILVLSALPHKEARYLLPVTPFLCLLAAAGLERTIAGISAAGHRAWHGTPSALLMALLLSLLHDAGGWRLARTDADVRLAREALPTTSMATGLAVEQLWRMGGRLYLGTVHPLIDIDPAQLGQSGFLPRLCSERPWMVLDERSFSRWGLGEQLQACSYSPLELSGTSSYRVFSPR